MADVVIAYMVMTSGTMNGISSAYIVMADVVVAEIVMADVVMAEIVMASETMNGISLPSRSSSRNCCKNWISRFSPLSLCIDMCVNVCKGMHRDMC